MLTPTKEHIMTNTDANPMHIMGPDLISPCGAGVGANGWHRTTPNPREVTCLACLEWVHA